MATASYFSPVVDDESRILILGTFPGEDSLEKGEYYADSRNQLWDILGNALENPGIKNNSYAQKVQFLLQHNIALWDVLKCVTRDGSSDNAIIDYQCNDLLGFLLRYPSIEKILFNGGDAADLFRKCFFKCPCVSSASPRLKINPKCILITLHKNKIEVESPETCAPPAGCRKIRGITLPSTSGVNTTLSVEKKTDKWREALQNTPPTEETVEVYIHTV